MKTVRDMSSETHIIVDWLRTLWNHCQNIRSLHPPTTKTNDIRRIELNWMQAAQTIIGNLYPSWHSLVDTIKLINDAQDDDIKRNILSLPAKIEATEAQWTVMTSYTILWLPRWTYSGPMLCHCLLRVNIWKILNDNFCFRIDVDISITSLGKCFCVQ